MRVSLTPAGTYTLTSDTTPGITEERPKVKITKKPPEKTTSDTSEKSPVKRESWEITFKTGKKLKITRDSKKFEATPVE